MNLKIDEVEKEAQESFLLSTPHTPFLQSSLWGNFQEKIGNKVYRMGIFKGSEIEGITSAYQIKAKFNSYLYIPWGPVLVKWSRETAVKIVDRLKEIAEKENLDFIRIEPRSIDESDVSTLKEIGLKETKSCTQPECTSLIDLSKSEEELLSVMSPSTRYNVRNVERKGVTVREGGEEDLKIFEKLLKETSQRHKFTADIHLDYYKNQYEILKKENIMDIFVAEFKGEPLAASLATFYGDTATYLHAASSRTQPQLRAPYLLVWKTIQESKQRGYRYFDFWGVAPENSSSNHPWSGVTSFKMSFGGERVCYAPVFDLPTSNKYLFSKFIEISRKPVKKIFRI